MVLAVDLAPYLVLIIVLLFYILIGFVMDIMSIILLAVPIIHPILVSLGFEPVWLAALTMVTILMGNISPPVGIVVFGLSSFVPDVPIFTIFRGSNALFDFDDHRSDTDDPVPANFIVASTYDARLKVCRHVTIGLFS